MKVVIAHNRYQSANPSGENRIVDSEIELLRATGVDVFPFIEDSDEFVGGSASAFGTAAVGPVVSPRGISRLRRLLHRHQPDVMHVHNVFPLISPWAVRTAVAAGVPVVQTVHNYRHTCVAGMHLRDGRICEDCRQRTLPWPAVQHACYRGSRLQSSVMALGQVLHRPTWRMVSSFLVASPHMQQRLVSTGVPADRVEWRPTFAEDAGVAPLPAAGGLAFVGRVEQAKGIELLLHAWTPAVARQWRRLVVVGTGPMQGLVEARAKQDPTVEWRGALDGEGVQRVMREARLVALPSLWFEGFPRVAAEAMSVGRPLLVWEGAGIRRLADFGAAWALDAEPQTWSRRLLELDNVSLEAGSRAARNFYEAHCAPAVAAQQLVRVYEAVKHSGLMS